MTMFRMALVFLIIGLLAGIIGFGGPGADAVLAAKLVVLVWLLRMMFVVFIILAGVYYVKHKFGSRNQTPA